MMVMPVAASPRDHHQRFRETLGVALVGVIDNALRRGEVTIAEYLLLGLQHQLSSHLAAACPQASAYLTAAMTDLNRVRASGGGGHGLC